MAIVVEQTATRTGSTQNHSVTFANAPVQGELIVVAMRISTTIALTLVAAGWTRVAGASIDDGAAVPAFSTQIFYKRAGAGESTTQTPATTAANAGSTTVGYRCSGALSAGELLDQAVEANSGTDSVGSITSPTITPTEDGEILIGVAGQSGNNNGSETIDSGFTVVTEGSNSNIHGYKIQTTAGAETVTFDWVATVRATVGIASFFADAGSDETVSASTVAVPATVGSPSVSTATTVSATTIAPVASIGTPTLATGSTVSPASIAAAASLDAPAVSSASTLAPSTVAAAASVADPSVSTGSDVVASPSVIAVVASVATPAMSVGSTIQPTTVAAGTSVSGSAKTPGAISVLVGASHRRSGGRRDRTYGRRSYLEAP